MRWALRAEGSHCSITWPVLLVNLILFFHSPLHSMNKWTTFHKFLTCDTSFTLSFQTFKFTCSTKYTDLLSTYHTDYFSSAMILRTTWIMQCVDRVWSWKNSFSWYNYNTRGRDNAHLRPVGNTNCIDIQTEIAYNDTTGFEMLF